MQIKTAVRAVLYEAHTASSADHAMQQLASVAEVLPRVPTLDDIRTLEQAMRQRDDQVELPVEHHFCTGLYARRLEIPKGSVIVGKMHAQENFFLLLKGEMSVWTITGMRRVKAPFMCVTRPGDKRVGYAHEDSVTINFHPNPDDENDIALLERRYIVDETELLADHGRTLLEVTP